MDDRYDIICVGGGIAGAGLAAVMARRGHRCLVLESTTAYPDRTKGEWLAPWGVLEARRAGLEAEVLSARGHVLTRHVSYDELVDPAEAESQALDLAMLPGVAGPLTQRHPDLCQVLLDAATEAGATCHRGVEVATLALGPTPSITWRTAEGEPHHNRCRLVVGADGRNSFVRRQLGIALARDRPHHLFSGLLVDGADDWPADTQIIGTEGELHYLAFPQGGGRVRLYLGFPLDRKRFLSGPDGPRRFVDSFRFTSVPGSAVLADATPTSPCMTYPNEDAWCDEPYGEGVVLIGDAAGWNDPIIGQGLSITMRDIRVVSELLCASDTWTPQDLVRYGLERSERMRRLRFTAALVSRLQNEFGAEARERRQRFRAAIAADPSLALSSATAMIGPDFPPPDAFTPERWQLLGACPRLC